jgi:hypothetical protein
LHAKPSTTIGGFLRIITVQQKLTQKMKTLNTLKLAVVFFATIALAACSQKLKSDGCPPQMCTMEFATVGVKFTDKAGTPVNVKEVKVENTRTNKTIVAQSTTGADNPAGNYVVVTDSNKKEISSNGDDIKITATTADGKTVSATMKIIGGCNCHVKRISGPETIVFE